MVVYVTGCAIATAPTRTNIAFFFVVMQHGFPALLGTAKL
jgi:hypothetical protein